MIALLWGALLWRASRSHLHELLPAVSRGGQQQENHIGARLAAEGSGERPAGLGAVPAQLQTRTAGEPRRWRRRRRKVELTGPPTAGVLLEWVVVE